jgi:hypothetical protein
MKKFNPKRVTEDMLQDLPLEDLLAITKDAEGCSCGDCICCLAVKEKTRRTQENGD